MSLQELNNVPGVTAQPDSATQQFVFNHTMLRVKDIEKSLDFYTRVLGFSLVEKRDFPEAEFSLYFLALVDKAQIPADDAARTVWMKSIPGILELTHNHGTEKMPTLLTTTATPTHVALVTSVSRYLTLLPRVSASKP